MEDQEHRAGGLWKTIGGPNLLCDNCHKELPRDATFGKGKHSILDKRKGKMVQWCTTCYYYYVHRDDPDIKERRKLR